MGESRANRDDAAGCIQRNIVNIHTRNAIYSQSSLRVSLFNIQPDCLSNTGMENTTEAPESIRASNRLERGEFLEGSARLTFRTAEYANPPSLEWIFLVCELHTERGIQTLGVFKITGSAIPAFSLLLTTSAKVEPTATILLHPPKGQPNYSKGRNAGPPSVNLSVQALPYQLSVFPGSGKVKTTLVSIPVTFPRRETPKLGATYFPPIFPRTTTIDAAGKS